MLVKDLPKQISDKTFWNLNDLFTYVYDNQLITEFWEIREEELTKSMKDNFLNAKKLSNSDFINL